MEKQDSKHFLQIWRLDTDFFLALAALGLAIALFRGDDFHPQTSWMRWALAADAQVVLVIRVQRFIVGTNDAIANSM